MQHITLERFNQVLNSDKSVVLQRWRIAYREIVIIILTVAITISALGVCIALIVSNSGAKADESVCTKHSCIEASAKLAAVRNGNADPCENFYNYACGGWQARTPETSLHGDDLEKTVFHLVEKRALDNLQKAVHSPTNSQTSDFEKKFKNFYASCVNDFQRSTLGAKPFIDRILRSAEGWQAIPNTTGYSNSTYDISRALEKVHVNFWQDALFSVHIGDDWLDTKKYTIQIGLGGLTLRWWDYVDNTTKHQKLFDDTKTFMRTIARLVIKDANTTMTQAEIDNKAEQFADDVFTFENMIAHTTWNTLPSDDPHAHQNRVDIGSLNAKYDQFDWESILKEMFRSAGVNSGTKIVLLEADFLAELNTIVKDLPNKKRTLNNYFTWRLMLGYVTDLGWEYVHANREFYVARTGLTEFSGIPVYCFNKVKYHFSDAVGALYIRDHLLKDDKDIIDEVVKYLKLGLKDHLSLVQWMEPSSLVSAIEKVNQIVDKVGYPTYLTNKDILDVRYKNLNIDKEQYLNNLIQIANFEKEKTNAMLKKGEDRSVWRNAVWETAGYYDLWWNELLITAGLLQWPIYAKSFPAYYNFGALGIILAHEMVHAIDEIGGYYLPNGTYFDWWTKNTTLMYNKRRACLEDLHLEAGPYYAESESKNIKIKIDGTYAAQELAAEMAAIKIAFYGYRDWVKAHQSEQLAPGLNLTNEQTMFLSYAQTQCFVRRDEYSISRAERHIMPEDIRLNEALKHTPEFADAFQCADGSTMKAKKMCEVF